MATKFQVGDRVVDKDGFCGCVRTVTQSEGSVWYYVRFSSGEAVRYDEDLAIQNPSSAKKN